MNSKLRRILKIISFILSIYILIFYNIYRILASFILIINICLFLFNESKLTTNILNIITIISMIIGLVTCSYIFLLITIISNIILLLIDVKENKEGFKKYSVYERFISIILLTISIIFVLLYTINIYTH